MKPKLFRQVWSWLGLLTLTMSVATFLRTTALDVSFPIMGLGGQSAHGVTVLALPLCGVLSLAFLWLTTQHARATDAVRLVDRLPVAFVDPDQFDRQSAGFQVFQRVFLGVFVILPPLALLPIFAKFLDATVSVGRPHPQLLLGYRALAHLWPPVAIDWAAAFKGEYSLDGPTYFPVVTPYVYLLFVVANLTVLVLTVGVLKGRRRLTRS